MHNSLDWWAAFKLWNYGITTFMQIWLAVTSKSLFDTCKIFSLESVAFELRVRKHSSTELPRRRQCGALTSRNFHWNIASPAQDKAVRRHKSHYNGLINGLICIYV
jgi:hypothetical protein